MILYNIKTGLAKYIQLDNSPHYLNDVYEFYSAHRDYVILYNEDIL